MSSADGHWYPARSSSQQAATLRVDGDSYRLTVNGEERHRGPLSELSVSDRTGNIARRITLSDESLFETDDNDSIDAILATTGHRDGRSSPLHRMESSWRWAIFGLFATVAVTLSFFKWGLPAIAYTTAHALPPAVHETVSKGTLETLDKWMLQESNLDDQQKSTVQARFDKLAANIDTEDFTLKLHFRDMHGLPNAFALPSGDIIVTDELVALANPPEELDSVILHEMGHVMERHGMQHAILASTLTLIVALAVGDVSGVGELMVSMPVFLMQSSYSRKSESSADKFAFAAMVDQGIDPRHFASVIRKLGSFSEPTDSDESDGSNTTAPDKTEKEESSEKTVDEDDQKLSDYFSSHPGFEERAIEAEAYSDRHFATQ